MKRLVLELDDNLHKSFKSRAAKEGVPMRKILTILLKKWIGAK